MAKANNAPALITFDIDWAPDFVIDSVASRLATAGVPATWFVTHDSPAVRRLKLHDDLFDLGIHPNFMRGSTHGATEKEVLEHCMNLVPDAVSIRTHGLVQSGNLFDLLMSETGMRIDSSLFLPECPAISVIRYRRFGKTLHRIPFYWEEDYAMESESVGLNEELWNVDYLTSNGSGIKIFNFHPIHVFLNSIDMSAYGGLKKVAPNLQSANMAATMPFVNNGNGTQTFLDELIGVMGRNSKKFKLKDLVG